MMGSGMQFHKRTGETCFEVGAICISVMFSYGTTHTPFIKAKERNATERTQRSLCMSIKCRTP